MGRYRRGTPAGRCWAWREGGGWLTAVVDGRGALTGDRVCFLYPDLETALVGRWEEGEMVRGAPALLTGFRVVGGVGEPELEVAEGPGVGRAISTEVSVGPAPLVRDPYESRVCHVRSSGVEGGGEGLYAARHLQAGEVVAFYNGVRLPYVPGQKEDWATSGYKIFVNADHSSGERIDLPGPLVDTDNYCATLGHKMNHSFDYNCVEWFFEHPRHGVVPCARTQRRVEAGEELLLHYGYDPGNCPPWYSDALATFLADHPDLHQDAVVEPGYKESGRKECLRDPDPLAG